MSHHYRLFCQLTELDIQDKAKGSHLLGSLCPVKNNWAKTKVNFLWGHTSKNQEGHLIKVKTLVEL